MRGVGAVTGGSRAACRFLTVALVSTPTWIQAGMVAGLQIPATVTDQSGTADTAGNLWAPAAGGQDSVLDQDATDNLNDSTDTTAPTATSSNVVAGDNVQTITFSEPINPATLACADLSNTGAATCVTAVLDGTNTIATITWNAALRSEENTSELQSLQRHP